MGTGTEMVMSVTTTQKGVHTNFKLIHANWQRILIKFFFSSPVHATFRSGATTRKCHGFCRHCNCEGNAGTPGAPENIE